MVSDGELTEINSANLEERTEIHENQKLTIIKVNYYNYQLRNKVKIKLLNLF